MAVRWRWLAALVVTLALGCGGDEKTWEWEVRPPAEMGMDATILAGARDYAFGADKHTQGVVVTRGGVLVAEWYSDEAGPDSYAASWSVAKSFASALIGIAIDEGAIADVDVPLTEYYPSWQDGEHDAIRLEHVLHQTTGLKWDESYELISADDSDVAELVLTTESPLAYVLERPVEAAPDTVFNYSSGNSLLFSRILSTATGMTTAEYAESRLFSRLGIKGADWWRATTGETLTYCCVDMTSRDFARFGLLYMNNGEWNGEQIVPSEWVQRSLRPGLNPEYGYQWWLSGATDSRLPADTFSAIGHDGQYIYVIPSLQLVVVRNGFYRKEVGEPIADPTLFLRYPPGGLIPGGGTLPPDSWDDEAFLGPIIDAIVD